MKEDLHSPRYPREEVGLMILRQTTIDQLIDIVTNSLSSEELRLVGDDVDLITSTLFSISNYQKDNFPLPESKLLETINYFIHLNREDGIEPDVLLGRQAEAGQFILKYAVEIGLIEEALNSPIVEVTVAFPKDIDSSEKLFTFIRAHREEILRSIQHRHFNIKDIELYQNLQNIAQKFEDENKDEFFEEENEESDGKSTGGDDDGTRYKM